MELNALAEARKRLQQAERNGMVYQPHFAATSAGWSFLAIAEALVAYLQSKTLHKGDDLR